MGGGNRKLRQAIGVACAIVIVLSAMTLIVPVANAARAYSGTLTIGIINKIDSLNPFRGIGNEAYLFYTLVYDPLFAVDQDQNLVPDIATDAKPTADATAWVYPIRQGVKWHDGTPLTADDVAFTFNYNIQNFVQLWAFQPYVNSLTSASVTGPNEVTLTFNGPFAPGKAFDAPYILQRTHWQGVNAKQAQYDFDDCDPLTGVYPVGSGPFMVDSSICDQWKNDLPIVLHRNPDYWAGPSAIEKLVFRHFNDEGTMVAALLKGEIDVAWLTAAGYKSIQDLKRQTPDPYPLIQQQEGLDVIQMWIDIGITQASNTKLNPARYDVNVRHAMAMATDKSFILDQFYKGKGRVGASLVSPVQPFWHYEPTAEETYPYSIAQANALLDAAGYDTKDANGIRSASRDIFVKDAGVTIHAGTRLSFSMVSRTEAPAENKIALYLQQNWKLIGIEMNPIFEDEATMTADVYGYYGPPAFDTYVWWWSSDPDPNYILSVQAGSTVGGWNDNFFNNASYNDAYKKQVGALDVAERQLWALQAQRIDYLAAPYIIVVYPNYEIAYWTDLWVGWGDMNAHPGRQVGAFFGKHPLFLELQPVGAPTVAVQGAAGRPEEPVTIRGQITDTTTGTWWLDFGDGNPLESGTYSAGTTDVTREHTYSLPQGGTQAEFTVKLSAANAAFNISKTNTVTIQAAGALPPTISSFNADKKEIEPGQRVNFSATARNPQAGTLTFTIDYGDGSAGDTKTVTVAAGGEGSATFTHLYTKVGSFPAVVTVAGTAGTTPAHSTSITIVVSGAAPVPSGVPAWVLPAVGLIVAVALAVTVVLAWRRRKQEREEMSELPPPPPKT